MRYLNHTVKWRFHMQTKRIISIVIMLALLTTLFTPVPSQAAPSQEFRGVWVATVLNLDYPSKSGVSVEQLKKEADSIINNAAAMGYNAIVLQVRPTADAFYKSDIFPWSSYLSTSQGTAPANGFDPLSYWVEQAHKSGLQLHAWINPFRVTYGSEKNKQHDVSKLAANHPARKNPGWTVAYSNGMLYFNPGLPEVRKLVIDGCVEIVKNYDVDGIHFDDYFYPGADFNDDATYTKYGAGFTSKADWRRDNVNKLIEETYNAVKAARSDAQFGISPVGIWANKTSMEQGSDTNGYQGYVTAYADSRKWVKSNWLDYIAPQIYWNIGMTNADYAKLVPWWADVVKGTNVKLYIGTAIYRSDEAKTSESAWYGGQEIARQAELNAKYPEVSGVIHYRYSTLKNNAIKDVVLAVFAADKPDNTAPDVAPVPVANELRLPTPQLGKLTVGKPTSANYTTSEYTTYYILGTCDPSKKLLVNGKEVTDISSEGYFGYYASLVVGINTYKFTQEGQTAATVTITRKTATGSQASPMSTVDIVAGSVFPKTANEYRKPGETVSLSCVAPIGATVKVTVGGTSYNMTPAAKTSSGKGAYPTTYTYQYTFPSTTATGKLVTIGTPKYSMTYNGKNYSRDAGGALVSITPNAPFYATVTSDNAYMFPNGSSTGGPKGELVKGQKDYVTAVASNGDWIRLAVGGWVQGSEVSLKSETSALKSEVSAAAYTIGDKFDTFSLKTKSITATDITFDGKTLVYTVSNTPAAPQLALPSGSLIKEVKAEVKGGATVYTMTVNDRFDGYYLTTAEDTLTLNLKRRPTAQEGDKPLTDIHILLDPGHGGTDSGATGPLGVKLAEKHMNLALSYKLKAILEEKGATVSLTRTGDTLPSLTDRVEISRKLRPDMFISLHTNSVVESSNSSNITGLETYYRNNAGKKLSDLLLSNVKTSTGYGNRNSKQANFFVVRPTWAPSALIETGFICNVGDFSRLTSDDEQYKLAALLAGAVIKYFS